jgi:hypothetical protein
MAVEYMLNREDWVAYYHRELEKRWERNWWWKLPLYVGFQGLIVTAFFGGITAGIFLLVFWVFYYFYPGAQQIAFVVAAIISGVFGLACVLASVITAGQIFREALRKWLWQLAESTVNRDIKRCTVEVGNKYQLTLSGHEMTVISSLEMSAAGWSREKKEEFHICWDAVCSVEVVAHLLVIRTNGPTVFIPKRAFASHLDFISFSKEVQAYQGDVLAAGAGGEDADPQRATTFQKRRSIQI